MNTNKIKNSPGFYLSLSTVIITIITFGIAINTPPISGVFCTENCIEYPYHDIADRFPRDYYWMFPAILIMLSYTGLIAAVHRFASRGVKVYSLIGLAFAIVSSTIIIINYFLQITVIQTSVLNGEFDGIALLTQYNPHGIFIALEELGFLIMSFSFLCLVPVFKGGGIMKALRWVFTISFLLSTGSLVYIGLTLGHERGYLFEIVIISITWLELIIAGILMSIFFRKSNVNRKIK